MDMDNQSLFTRDRLERQDQCHDNNRRVLYESPWCNVLLEGYTLFIIYPIWKIQAHTMTVQEQLQHILSSSGWRKFRPNRYYTNNDNDNDLTNYCTLPASLRHEILCIISKFVVQTITSRVVKKRLTRMCIIINRNDNNNNNDKPLSLSDLISPDSNISPVLRLINSSSLPSSSTYFIESVQYLDECLNWNIITECCKIMYPLPSAKVVAQKIQSRYPSKKLRFGCYVFQLTVVHLINGTYVVQLQWFVTVGIYDKDDCDEKTPLSVLIIPPKLQAFITMLLPQQRHITQLTSIPLYDEQHANVICSLVAASLYRYHFSPLI